MMEKGALVYCAQPFMYVIGIKSKDVVCDFCAVKSTNLQLCADCEFVRYCDAKCQEKGWAIHQHECQDLRNYHTSIIEQKIDNSFASYQNRARLISRIIDKLDNDGDKEVEFYSKTGFIQFNDLLSYKQKFKDDPEKYSQFKVVRNILKEMKPATIYMTDDEILEVYGKIEINSFAFKGETGIGVYLAPSVMSHSCDPNVMCTVLDGKSLSVIAVKDILEPDLSKCTYCYTSELNLEPASVRRKFFLDNYFFMCSCKKCTSPDPIIACPKKECLYNCEIKAGKCDGCGTKFPEGWVEKYRSMEKLTKAVMEDEKNRNDFEVLGSCVMKQIGIFHLYNVDHLRMLKLAILSINDKKYMEDAEYLIARAIKAYSYHLDEFCLEVYYLFLQQAVVKFLLNKRQEGAPFMVKARMISAILGSAENIVMDEEEFGKFFSDSFQCIIKGSPSSNES